MTNIGYLNKNFTYTPDPDRGFWKVMRKPPFRGDCEDYALTLLWLECGRKIWPFIEALLVKDARICHYTSKRDGGGHAGLMLDARFADNTTKVWSEDTPRGYEFEYFYSVPKVFGMLVKGLFRKRS